MSTKAAHTPGNWTYQPTAGKHDFSVYSEATGRTIALVRDFDEANARLIAAAPRMRELLTMFVSAESLLVHPTDPLCAETVALLARIDGTETP